MNLEKPWKLILLLVGIFVSGAVTGSFATLMIGKKMAQSRPAPDQWISARFKMIAERLELTPPQVEKLEPIMRRNAEDLKRLRQDGMRDTRRIVERMEKEIAAVLTPEQRVKFDVLSKEMAERARRFMEQREQRRHEPRGVRPPGENAGMGERHPPPPPPLPDDGK
ncbi:MAG: hypothetical protein Q8M02_00320 [Candidatus Didemnitutus sp.]|nr:hypothetical protein [Candidatus Didemnitutus sp.]